MLNNALKIKYSSIGVNPGTATKNQEPDIINY